MARYTFEAHCYASQSAYSEDVTVDVNEQGQFAFEFQNEAVAVFIDELTVSSRLGNTPRFIDLPNGLRLETSANDLIDQLLRSLVPESSAHTFIHKIESSFKWVLVLLVVVVVSSWGAYRYGIPALAKMTSPVVPDQVRRLTSQSTLSQMDNFLLEDTQLFSWQRRHYRELLANQLQPLIETEITLDFRHSDAMGANAFALPDGTVIFTDQLIQQLTDEEFLAIAAHEMGHVAGDHGMRSVISSTSLVLAITLLTGDSEAISELLVTAPTLLMQLTYSRDLEREADDFAMDYMNQANLDLEHYAAAMEKIIHAHDLDESDNNWMAYLSTHPEPFERIAKFRTAAEISEKPVE